jgi:hypothetical protein
LYTPGHQLVAGPGIDGQHALDGHLATTVT